MISKAKSRLWGKEKDLLEGGEMKETLKGLCDCISQATRSYTFESIIWGNFQLAS